MSKEVEKPIDYKLPKIRIDENMDDTIFFNFVTGGISVEVHGYSEKTYTVVFTDEISGKVHGTFENVKAGEFRTVNPEYYIQWNIKVVDESNDETIKNYTLDLKGKTVLITYESSALGDTLAWMPYIDEFRKKHECKVICSSFYNELFAEIYPEIQYIPRGQPLQGVHVSYKLGWFGSGHANDKNPYDCHTIPLQKVATDILGLEYSEIRPELKLPKNKEKKMFNKGKYVVITTSSTAQFKYWNNHGGWQNLVDWLVAKGYSVVNIGKQPNFLKNVHDFTGKRDFFELMNVIKYSEFFVGITTGPCWYSWAIGKKTVFISGITEAFCDFRSECYRVENKEVCHGCFNDPKETFDKGDWMYCPRNKGTKDHFICTKEIKPDMVKETIKQVEKDLLENKSHMAMTDVECTEYLASMGQ